ncbi:MAG: molybdopterin molybdotransferase MoeA [Rhodobacteraceae bacterium]|nr:molybdopterin molybdotransferase MoeA [Paracoccaceae bacterium]
MISVTEALDHLFALVAPLCSEQVGLQDAAGRVLAEDAIARREQPPFAASAMDGYAVRGAETESGTRLCVIGEAAAGHAFAGPVGAGEAVRIFTGAPLPEGTDRIVIQEDVTRDGDTVILSDRISDETFVRPAGSDFAIGSRLSAPRVLSPADLALLASMNLPQARVARRPDVAIIATGDELVMPGEDPRPDQIVASNAFGLKALLDLVGARCRIMPIARDTLPALQAVLGAAADADLILTIGGASVGDHDLLGTQADALGLSRNFYKVSMRPGKPLMAGRIGEVPLIGLPGNPVSALVCGTVFVAPVIRRMLGLPAEPTPRAQAILTEDIPANGPREHYARATLGPDGVRVFNRQDSSLLTVLSAADALVVRPPHAPAAAAGTPVEMIRL